MNNYKVSKSVAFSECTAIYRVRLGMIVCDQKPSGLKKLPCWQNELPGLENLVIIHLNLKMSCISGICQAVSRRDGINYPNVRNK